MQLTLSTYHDLWAPAGAEQDLVKGSEQNGVGYNRFSVWLSGEIRQRKTKDLPALLLPCCQEVVGMEIDLEEQSQEGGDQTGLATSFLPSENQRLCSLLNRIEGHLTQMKKERPHKQEDRDIDPSLVQVIQLW